MSTLHARTTAASPARTVKLVDLPLPDFGALGDDRPPIPTAEYEARLAALRSLVDARWIAVYGDREHFANLAYLCAFDPRFEEALLLLGPDSSLLVVGLEGLGYATLVPVDIPVALCPTFGLVGQDRTRGATLGEIVRTAGIGPGDSVAVVGWKTIGAAEWAGDGPAIAAPAYIVDTLRAVAGAPERVTDAAGAMTGMRSGLRTRLSAAEVAEYEWAAARASASVRRIMLAARVGETERDAVRGMRYDGEPLSAHVMFSSGPEVAVGLRSPGGRRLERGDAVTTAVGFRGGLTCRAGLLVADESELDAGNASYLSRMAIPYWTAIASWYETVAIGATGAEVHDVVADALAAGGFGAALNPGHLISLDEWPESPIAAGSDVQLRSGMALQCDIIPDNARPGWAANCEDTVVLADAALRREIEASSPDAWSRITARRRFVAQALGLSISDDLLPLSTSPAYLAPFWLAPNRAFTLLP